MFAAKKLIAALVYPLPMALLAMALGAALARHRPRAGRALIAAAGAALAVAALPQAANFAARSLEDGLRPIDVRLPTAAQAIVVLSSGSRAFEGGGPWERLDRAALKRVLEGVRLKRAYPDLPLILTGGVTQAGEPPHAIAMSELAIWAGVPAADIELELASRDTHDHPRHLAARLGRRPFLLVTSATHMPRALALFRARGLRPIAAPTDFIDSRAAPAGVRGWIPDARALTRFTTVVHEWYGLCWAYLRGQIGTRSELELTRTDRVQILRGLPAPVAQLDRVPGYEPGGRGFESSPARQPPASAMRKPRRHVSRQPPGTSATLASPAGYATITGSSSPEGAP